MDFCGFGAPVGIPKRGQNPFPPLPHPCLVGLGWVLMAQLEPLGGCWHHFMTVLGAILELFAEFSVVQIVEQAIF